MSKNENQSGRSRNWTFTSFANEPPALTDSLKYLCYGVEACPSTGRKHFQGYMVAKEALSLGSVKKKFPEISHWEIARGTPKDNVKYCKKDGDFHQFGELPNPGKRNDLSEVAAMVLEGKNMVTIAEACPEQFIKFNKGIAALKNVILEAQVPSWRDIHVVYIWGPTDTNKSRSAEMTGQELYGGDYYKKPMTKSWFDNYSGQQMLWLDEVCPENVNWSDMLQWLDGYKLMVEVKHGFTYAMWDGVVITSNYSPQELFPNKKDISPFLRRLGKIFYTGPEPDKSVSPKVGGNTKPQPCKPSCTDLRERQNPRCLAQFDVKGAKMWDRKISPEVVMEQNEEA